MPPRRPDEKSRASARRERLEKLSDGHLVGRCRAGDPTAWTVLVHRYRRLVYTIPYRMGLDPAEADDVFQITFTRLTEKIGGLTDPSRVRAWLVTTTRRVALNQIRRRPGAVDPEEALSEIADPAELPPEELARLEDQQLVRIALSRLGGRCERLLSRLYYPDARTGEAASYDEVSRDLGIPLGSIGPTRMRCLKKLLTEYRKLGP